MKENKDKIQQDEKLIQKEFDLLLQDYLNSNHRKKVAKIKKAFDFAKSAHAGVRRRSGEPYILHPISVARIISKEIGMGSTSISAALLHDVVEDTHYTVEDIKEEFGEKIANIVDGLTKISGGIFGAHASSQAENFKHLLLTMSQDIRVILIKIADRLHNMRTLGSMRPNKQYKIAGETLYIYAPLAHRLGLFAIKTELEDLSFKYEHPAIFKTINDKIKSTQVNRANHYLKFIKPIENRLKEMEINYKIEDRLKSVYSIWRKMQKKKVTFEEVYDILAVRLIFETPEEKTEKKTCWEIYTCITDIYQVHPDRTRDWISTPKANGYQALHLTVMGPQGMWIEVQIRSKRMNEIAEKGVAAHWKYKDENSKEEGKKDSFINYKSYEFENWLGTVREILENPEPNAIDFLDTIKLNLFASEVFIFTPKGEIKTLPQGATALDFAFLIHQQVGFRCIGAKVNHKLVPLSYKLKSGDQIEIIQSKAQSPQAEWLNFVTTALARGQIRTYLRKEKRKTIESGNILLLDFLKKAGIDLDDRVLNNLIHYFEVNNKQELFFKIGSEAIELNHKIDKIIKGKEGNRITRYLQRISGRNNKTVTTQDAFNNLNLIDKKKTYILTDDGIRKNYTVASCCQPIPGDDVFGFFNPQSNDVIVHKRSCAEALKLKSNFGDQLLKVEWENKRVSTFPANIQIKGIDDIGVLHQITQVISNDNSINIKKVVFETNDGIFKGDIQMVIQNTNDLTLICNKLKKLKAIQSVNRIDIQ